MTNRSKNTLAFLLGLGSITQIRIIGSFAISEIFCLFLAPFVFLKCFDQIHKSRMWSMLGFAILWFFSAVGTDCWHESVLINALKGCGAIVVLITAMICAFGLLRDDLMRIRYYAVGVAGSYIISIFAFQPASLVGWANDAGTSISEIMDYQRFYVSVVMSGLAAIAAIAYGKMPGGVTLLLLAIAGLNLMQGSRSAFLFCLLAATIAVMGRVRDMRKMLRNSWKIVMVMTITLLASKYTYEVIVQKGWMGDAELRKYENAAATKIGLLSGRSEFFAAGFAIKDSPIMGYGSWALDKEGYGLQCAEWLGDEEKIRIESFYLVHHFVDYIPSHSHIMGAWVWHGFLGFVFWLAVFIWIIRYFRNGLLLCRPLIAFNAMSFSGALWALFFSPISMRIAWGILLATIAVTLTEVDRRRRLQQTGVPISMYEPWDGKPRDNTL
jgi:hypothetical protein